MGSVTGNTPEEGRCISCCEEKTDYGKEFVKLLNCSVEISNSTFRTVYDLNKLNGPKGQMYNLKERMGLKGGFRKNPEYEAKKREYLEDLRFLTSKSEEIFRNHYTDGYIGFRGIATKKTESLSLHNILVAFEPWFNAELQVSAHTNKYSLTSHIVDSGDDSCPLVNVSLKREYDTGATVENTLKRISRLEGIDFELITPVKLEPHQLIDLHKSASEKIRDMPLDIEHLNLERTQHYYIEKPEKNFTIEFKAETEIKESFMDISAGYKISAFRHEVKLPEKELQIIESAIRTISPND
jgi:hypothetical protein